MIHGAGIYANIGGILMVNVTIYSIHGSYGYRIPIVLPGLSPGAGEMSCRFCGRHGPRVDRRAGPRGRGLPGAGRRHDGVGAAATGAEQRGGAARCGECRLLCLGRSRWPFDGQIGEMFGAYPLVNIQKAIENGHL